MKKVNVIVKNYPTTELRIKALLPLCNHEETLARNLLEPDYAGRIGFKDYQLTNNSANIRRIRDRVFVCRYPGGPAYVSCTRADVRYTSRLAGGSGPLDPRQSRKARAMRQKTARAECPRIRLNPEEKELLRFNAGVQGLSIADHIRQTCLGVRLRKTPEEKNTCMSWPASARTSISSRSGRTPTNEWRKRWRY